MTNSPEWFTGRVMVVVNEADRVAVRHAQRVLRLEETGELDDQTKAYLRGFQGLFGLPRTAILDEATAIKLEQVRNQYA